MFQDAKMPTVVFYLWKLLVVFVDVPVDLMYTETLFLYT